MPQKLTVSPDVIKPSLQRVVVMTEALAAKLEVPRLKDTKDGFQRNLRGNAECVRMANLFATGIDCPPIMVNDIGGRLVVMDGQHRLHAWTLKHFPMFVVITKKESIKDSAKSFVAVNGTSVRVSLIHRLRVDPSHYAQKIRALCEKYNLHITQASSLMIGIIGQGTYYHNPCQATEEQFSLADTVLTHWVASDMWGKKAYVYSWPAVLKMVGALCSKSSKPHVVINKLRKLNYSKVGGLAARAGSSGASQRRMREFVYKFLIEGAS